MSDEATKGLYRVFRHQKRRKKEQIAEFDSLEQAREFVRDRPSTFISVPPEALGEGRAG